jgi:hypothetical protein
VRTIGYGTALDDCDVVLEVLVSLWMIRANAPHILDLDCSEERVRSIGDGLIWVDVAGVYPLC